MQSRFWQLGLCTIAASCTLAACVERRPPTGTPPTEAPGASPTSPGATPSQMLTAAPSPTAEPDLYSEAAYGPLLEMFQAHRECALPCFWGITPGRSTRADVDRTLRPLGTVGRLTGSMWSGVRGSAGIDLGAKSGGVDIAVDVYYSLQYPTGTVELTEVSSRALTPVGPASWEDAFGAEPYEQLLADYTLPAILSRYGTPHGALMDVYAYPGEGWAPTYFYLWLTYPAHGAILEYTGALPIEDGIAEVCPSRSTVRMWLLPPDDEDLFREAFQSAVCGRPCPDFDPEFHLRPVDAVFGITMTEFLQMFSQPTEACLRTALSDWPMVLAPEE